MPRTGSDPKGESVTFRIDPGLKAALADIAEKEAKPLGELMRELALKRVEQARWREFEAEARRQSLEAAAAAREPGSDEAQVMRELDSDLDELPDEWK